MSILNPRKILFVHYGLDWMRGSEQCLLDLLTHIDRERFHPVVWCNSEVMADAVRDLKIDVAVDRFPLLFGWESPRFDAKSYMHLVKQGVKQVRQHGVQLIHSNSGGPCQWLAPVARTTNLPLLLHLHCRYGLRDRCTLGLHQASHVVGVSHPVIRGLHEDGMAPHLTEVIHNGVDIQRIKSQHKKDIRGWIGAFPEDLVIATTGSLIERKGIDLLLKAVRILLQRRVPVRLVVIGDGPDRFRLQQMSAELGVYKRVSFLGERNDVGAVLQGGVDVFVSGAREEVFGLALVEAGIAELPVVAPRVGGVSEVVEGGVSGILVEPESPHEISMAIERLARDKVLRKRMGVAGYQRALNHFSVVRYVSDFQDRYENLLQRPEARLSWSGPWRCGDAYRRWLVGAGKRRAQRWAGEVEKRIVSSVTPRQV